MTLEAPLGQQFYMVMHTRPSPIPPAELDLAILEVGHLRALPGIIFPETMPTFSTIAWCVDGAFTLAGRGWEIETPAGCVAVMSSNQYVTTQTDKGCEAYYLLLDGPQMDEIIYHNGLWPGHFPYQLLPIQWLQYLSEQLSDLSAQPSLATVGVAILQDAVRQAERGARDTLVWQARCFLHQNWQNPKTNVEAVLAHLRVSRSTLSPRFKAETGNTITEYLSTIRLYNATKMLANEPLTIKQIAFRCGFPDPAHFSKWFKQQCGKNPREMKEKV